MFDDLDYTSEKAVMTKCLGTYHRTFIMAQRPFNLTSNKSGQDIINIHVFIPYFQAKAPTDDTIEAIQSITFNP